MCPTTSALTHPASHNPLTNTPGGRRGAGRHDVHAALRPAAATALDDSSRARPSRQLQTTRTATTIRHHYAAKDAAHPRHPLLIPLRVLRRLEQRRALRVPRLVRVEEEVADAGHGQGLRLVRAQGAGLLLALRVEKLKADTRFDAWREAMAMVH